MIWEGRYRQGYGTDCPSEDFAMFLSDLRPGKLLDLGCGTGANMLYAVQKGWKVSGIDESEIAVKKAQQRLGDHPYSLVLGSIMSLPVRFREFDAVIDIECTYCLPLSDARQVYDEIHAMLKPGGKVLTKAFAEGCWTGKEVVAGARMASWAEMETILSKLTIEKSYLLERNYGPHSIREWVITAGK